MARRKLTDAEIRAQLPRARSRSRAALRAVRAEGVLFERASRRLLLTLTNGCVLAVPVSVVPALQPVPDAEMERVRVDPLGLGLHWDQLDLDVSVSALIQAVLGPSLLHSAAGAQGGKARTRAKVLAAQRNGRKGGRPRKQRSGKT